jgi:hypothetical protein
MGNKRGRKRLKPLETSPDNSPETSTTHEQSDTMVDSLFPMQSGIENHVTRPSSRADSRRSNVEDETEVEEYDEMSEGFTAASNVLRTSESSEMRAMGTLLEAIWSNQRNNAQRIRKLEKAVQEVQGVIHDVVEVNEVVQTRVNLIEHKTSALERELVRLEREVNDSFIVIAGIPEAKEEEDQNGNAKTREIASAVLIDGGFGELAKKMVSAWRPKKRTSNQNQSAGASNRIIMVKFESLQARRKIMGRVKSLSPSAVYPKRKFYPKRSPLELKGQFRLKSVMTKLLNEGWKLEQKWGGFVVEGINRVFMPLDFLPSFVTIKGVKIDVDRLSALN